MARQFDAVTERDEGGIYIASVPHEFVQRSGVGVAEAIELCLEAEGREPRNLEFIGIHRVSTGCVCPALVICAG